MDAAAETLLENQRLMNANQTTADVMGFKRIPLVRRIYPQLIANKVVSVQPLLGPTGLITYLNWRYSQNKGQTINDNKGQTINDNKGQTINDNTWVIKPKKKKIWRDITEPWEPSDGME